MVSPKYKSIAIITDAIILTASFIITLWVKHTGIKSYIPLHLPLYFGLVVVWILVSLFNGKLLRNKVTDFNSLFSKVLSSNFIAVSTLALIMYVFRDYDYSRIIVLGTSLLSTILELISGSVYLAYKKATVQNIEGYENSATIAMPDEYELVTARDEAGLPTDEPLKVNTDIIAAIESECGTEMTAEIIKMTGRNLSDKTAVLSTTSIFNITSLPHQKYNYIINLHRINDTIALDNFLNAVNSKLEQNGYFFCCCETKEQRKRRLLKKYPPILNYIFYTFDFILKRVLPKIKFTYRLYFFLTRGNNSVISRAEALGRLSRAGFVIRQESFIRNLLCVEAWKVSEPFPVNESTYGPLIALPRVGKGGKMIKVYKLRTMHPYSEYIQNYVYSLYDLQNGGKFKNDFRITTWGAICRRIWFDELPMFINLIKGEMKLVGVRPLSQQYFELYNKDVRERRIKYKPGLIPPYYADMPENIEEIQASEMKYLDSFDRHPIITDFRYFWKSWYNILFQNARSK